MLQASYAELAKCRRYKASKQRFVQAVCRICQLGMVCRHADDMLPLLKIMSGLPDGTEDHTRENYQSIQS